MSYILDGLYMGSVEDAWATDTLRNDGVTHILTLDMSPLPSKYHEGFTYKHVHALDMPDYDLLSKVTECIQFIGEGRQQGGVLVHCYQGVSRSAAVVLAYIMHKLDMGLQDATAMLHCVRPVSQPNPGFIEQLELFEKMGCKVDTEHQLYKQYRLQILAQLVQSSSVSEEDFSGQLSSDPTQGIDAGAFFYKCKKCRRALFTKSAVLTHEEGPGQRAFTWQAKHDNQPNNDPNKEPDTCTRSLFIEPVEWMREDVCELAGKITCPKCSSKLGTFDWSGSRCSCGQWVTPSFHIQVTKVDLSRHVTSQPVTNVYQTTKTRLPVARQPNTHVNQPDT